MQKIKKFLKTRTGIATAVIIIILIALLAFFGGKAEEKGTFTIDRSNFEKVVSISGKVIPAQSVELGFETSGTVARVYKDVGVKVYRGEAIAALDSSDIVAQRDIAKADLLMAEAELSKIINSEADSDVSTNKEQIINAITDAYTTADDAVHNKVDQFFDNARTSGPKIKYTFYDYFSTKPKINDGRALIEKDLENFGIMANSLTPNNYSDSKLRDAKRYVQKVKAFLDIVSPAVNSYEESNILTSTMISGYRSDIATARTNINTTLSDLTTFEDNLRSSFSDALIQEAKVKSKEANVRNYDAEVAKTVIVAPFSGVISDQDAKVGESVSANSTMTTMISDGYQVEAFIPEVNISGISVGNTAKVRLDAYGDEEFSATIIHIDPAETVRDGVSNYRIKLAFDKADARVLSGMTADVEIVTEKIMDTFVIPERALVTEGEKKYVMKVVGKEKIKTEVVVGRKDGKGNVEITSGIEVGNEIVLNPEKN